MQVSHMLLPRAGNLDDVRFKSIDVISTPRLSGGYWFIGLLGGDRQ